MELKKKTGLCAGNLKGVYRETPRQSKVKCPSPREDCVVNQKSRTTSLFFGGPKRGGVAHTDVNDGCLTETSFPKHANDVWVVFGLRDPLKKHEPNTYSELQEQSSLYV